MKEWTREERYRVLQNADEIQPLYEKIRSSVYRQQYHVQPITGLSSDPNGFALHQGIWHLCYQWCPWGAVHGLKYWYHVTSRDLLHWKNEGIGLAPDRDYDNKGTHSGSAISVGDRLYFFYTGNHRDENWIRTPWTCAAFLDVKGKLQKLDAPLFGPRADHSEHQRDPKIVWNAEKGKYYIFIGAQTLDLRGCVLVYESDQPLNGWTYAGELKVPGYEHFGGMWECPYIVRIGSTDVLIFSPQYTKLPGRGESTNHNVYLLGRMDYDTLTFTPDGTYQYLDFGFDFYAAQGAANVDDPDKAILIGWIGLPDNHYPTEEEDWEGSMSLPRELRIRDGKLIQTPISDIESLRDKALTEDSLLPKAGELMIDLPEGSFDLALYTKADGSGGLKLHYNGQTRILTVDRRGMDKRFNQQVFEVLDVPMDAPLKTMRVFIDHSSTEFFFNDGEKTFTTHTYPTGRECCLKLPAGATAQIWSYHASVTDEFVV